MLERVRNAAEPEPLVFVQKLRTLFKSTAKLTSHISATFLRMLSTCYNTKLAGLITLLKTVLEKAAQKTSLPPPHTTKSQQKLKKRSSTSSPAVPKTLTPPLTKKDLLSVGLMHAGFDLIRQQNVKHQTNIDRFKAFYGLEPTTLVPVFTDVKDRFPEATFHHLLLTMNWLTLYDKYLVPSGRWGYHPDTIGPMVWRYARMQLQTLP